MNESTSCEDADGGIEITSKKDDINANPGTEHTFTESIHSKDINCDGQSEKIDTNNSNFLSTVSMPKKGLEGIWNQHLHYPQSAQPTTKKAAKKQTPYALTGKLWKAQNDLKKEELAAKQRLVAERLSLRIIKREIKEAEAAERLRLRKSKQESTALAKAEKVKLKEEKLKLREETLKMKQAQVGR